jgi:hypothetical protein
MSDDTDERPAEGDRLALYDYDNPDRTLRAIVSEVTACEVTPEDPDRWDARLRYVHDSHDEVDVPSEQLFCCGDLGQRGEDWAVLSDDGT